MAERRKISKGDRAALAEQMHEAVDMLILAKVRELLASGVPPDVWGITHDDDLPLQAVARAKGAPALSIAKALIDAGADIDYQGDYGCTALARATERDGEDDWAMARYLIQSRANASIADSEGLNAAESASTLGHNGAILAMLDAGMDPNLRGIAGPLIWYAAYDSPEVVKALLARGVEPESKAYGPGCAGETPLFRAADSWSEGGLTDGDFIEIAIALIDAGADPAQLDPAPDCLASYLLARREQDEFSGLPKGTSNADPHGPL